VLIAINYHYVRMSFDEPHPGIHGVTPSELQRHLALLRQCGTLVGADALRAAVHGAELPARAILITFDDGLREQIDCACPVLTSMGVPALFFVNTGPIADRTVSTVHKVHVLRARLGSDAFIALLTRHARRHDVALTTNVPVKKILWQYPYDTPATARLKFMLNFTLHPSTCARLISSCFDEVFPAEEADWSEQLYMDEPRLAVLAADEQVGTHGHQHVPLGLLPAEDIDFQLTASLDLLERWTGRRPWCLSYPFGSMDACSGDAAAVARRAGIEAAFTMERAANSSTASPLHLARLDNQDLPWAGGRSGVEQFLDTLPQSVWSTEMQLS
jgi:peptidoglycan/xylan/chitin deacetylase (PgdA/CDA1 family)